MALSDIEQFAEEPPSGRPRQSGDDANPSYREEAFTEEVLALLAEHNEVDSAELCTYEAREDEGSPSLQGQRLGVVR